MHTIGEHETDKETLNSWANEVYEHACSLHSNDRGLEKALQALAEAADRVCILTSNAND